MVDTYHDGTNYQIPAGRIVVIWLIIIRPGHTPDRVVVDGYGTDPPYTFDPSRWCGSQTKYSVSLPVWMKSCKVIPSSSTVVGHVCLSSGTSLANSGIYRYIYIHPHPHKWLAVCGSVSCWHRVVSCRVVAASEMIDRRAEYALPFSPTHNNKPSTVLFPSIVCVCWMETTVRHHKSNQKKKEETTSTSEKVIKVVMIE